MKSNLLIDRGNLDRRGYFSRVERVEHVDGSVSRWLKSFVMAAAVCLAVLVRGRHVREVEARDAGLRDAHEDGEVDERLGSGVAGDLQLDRMVEVRHRQRIGGVRHRNGKTKCDKCSGDFR